MGNNFSAKISKPNLTILIALLAVGAGEYFDLTALRLIGIHLAIIAGIIQVIVLIAYAIDFCVSKYNKNHQQKSNTEQL